MVVIVIRSGMGSLQTATECFLVARPFYTIFQAEGSPMRRMLIGGLGVSEPIIEIGDG